MFRSLKVSYVYTAIRSSMNFAAAFFTDLSPDGPNRDFVPSMRARLLYAHKQRLDPHQDDARTESPYALDAPVPHIVPVVIKDDETVGEIPELDTYMGLITGRFNEAARLRLGREMRTRDAVDLFTKVISNGLRCDSAQYFPDVQAFAESIKARQAVFPLHPALVIGFGFNVADTLFHPYYGARHTSWSLTEDKFAFRLAKLYEKHVRDIVLDRANSNDFATYSFVKAIDRILQEVQNDVSFIDTKDFLKAWAKNGSYSFAPLVRLYAAFVEPVFPFANFMQVFDERITAAIATDFALNV